MAPKKKKKRKPGEKGMQVILLDTKDPKQKETVLGEHGIFFGKADIKLLYNALANYKPTDKEKHLHSVLLEQFEEILVVDYDEPYPEAN